ncbi:MAG: hypothetical protein H7A18_01220 [Sinobacteraceae bacterium]|nr:hypothetical protein [Nevskiaceae bacterium]
MSDTSKETPTWTDVYFKSQEDFVRRWSEMANSAAHAATGGNAGATTGRDWFAMFAPYFPGASGDLAKRYFGFYDPYLASSRALWEQLSQAMAHAEPSARAQAFVDGMQALQQPFTRFWQQSTAPFGMSATPGIGADDLLQSWSKLWGAHPGSTDWLQSLAKASGGNAAELPALGLTRERQESLQRIQSLSQQLLQTQAQLAQIWSGIIGDALKALGERVGRKLAAGETIDSSRTLYDLWVESAEEAYARTAFNPTYAKAQAELANTMAKLRIEQRVAIESVAKIYDLPTREELNTVHRRLRDLKAELRRVNAKLDATQRASAGASTSRKANTSKKGK